MSALLVVNSSPLMENSVTRELSAAFLDQWKALNPEGIVLDRDLYATEIKPVSASWVAAAFTPEDARTPEQASELALSDVLLGELRQADEYVIGVPMHNFGIPSSLKLWIDQIARLGETFAYVDGGPQGLLTGKKVTFIVSSGSFYDAATQRASFNFVEPYLRAAFGFIGVKAQTFLTVGGAGALNRGADRSEFLAPHLEAVRAHLLQPQASA